MKDIMDFNNLRKISAKVEKYKVMIKNLNDWRNGYWIYRKNMNFLTD